MTALADNLTSSVYDPVMTESSSQLATSQATKNEWDQLIAKDFSSAAKGYHKHNIVQQHASAILCEHLQVQGTLLDIGAGPGTDFSHCLKLDNVMSIDIAAGMLKKLKDNFPNYHGIQGDAQSLPLLNKSVNAIYSNLALQWCHNFEQAVMEAARVLKPSGSVDISVVVENSLPELSSLGFKVNRFHPFDTLVSCFKEKDWQLREAKIVPVTVYFDDLKSLLYSIKGVGASVLMNRSEPSSLVLRGRQDWQALNEKAQSLRQEKGIPLTYYIAIIRAKRQCHRV
ncbi:methyltransferase domain-containing protein [uncultured Shewanella sp.]|uniref:methyltransferase domain-containing protein n=1 Tax=uncultured Shewanella sp. TaxID=173975 RepID=UPI0026390D92|nr:methyltransferase domain-containing protein [uncultured Shewanella sp.]